MVINFLKLDPTVVVFGREVFRLSGNLEQTSSTRRLIILPCCLGPVGVCFIGDRVNGSVQWAAVCEEFDSGL